jgi:hypothetical protein
MWTWPKEWTPIQGGFILRKNESTGQFRWPTLPAEEQRITPAQAAYLREWFNKGGQS